MGGGESELVRDLKNRDASTWYGEVNGRGINGMITPGGKEGAQMRVPPPLWAVNRPAGGCCRIVLLFFN